MRGVAALLEKAHGKPIKEIMLDAYERTGNNREAAKALQIQELTWHRLKAQHFTAKERLEMRGLGHRGGDRRGA